ncbi:hypothetical protein FIBSPDRAFT_901956 [Athelia psychrophila]|uniref:Uncharacterized protein n=1 Tax=Athelia psychrophila TaxID=1759441 RepID=A0A165WE22_9AGAM|nr:hypothetical protein FIBSPDRAFT_901956 [Fibularhizoctonia sp. CBS 109695]
MPLEALTGTTVNIWFHSKDLVSIQSSEDSRCEEIQAGNDRRELFDFYRDLRLFFFQLLRNLPLARDRQLFLPNDLASFYALRLELLLQRRNLSVELALDQANLFLVLLTQPSLRLEWLDHRRRVVLYLRDARLFRLEVVQSLLEFLEHCQDLLQLELLGQVAAGVEDTQEYEGLVKVPADTVENEREVARSSHVNRRISGQSEQSRQR